MTEQEIEKRVLLYIEEAPSRMQTVEDARKFNEELHKFVEENKLTVEQWRPFVNSGYGEMLYMLLN